MSLPADLRAFRVASMITGISSLLLWFVAIPLKYLLDRPGFSEVYSPLHGLVFMVYVGVVVWVTTRRGWSPFKGVLVILAGTVPFASFVTERKVMAEELASLATDPSR